MNDSVAHASQKQSGTVRGWITVAIMVAGVVFGAFKAAHDFSVSVYTDLRHIDGRIRANEVHRETHDRESDRWIERIRDNTLNLDRVEQRLGELSAMSQARGRVVTEAEGRAIERRLELLEDRLE
jgi:hypothetical protein